MTVKRDLDARRLVDLEKTALQIRIGIVEQLKSIGFGHAGGSLSIADLIAVLYDEILYYNPENPLMPERDKVVCSKGHAGPALYAALAIKGFFPYKDLRTLNQPGTYLPSHCDRNRTPGIDMTTGSLGQGCSLAVGMAMGDALRGYPSKTYLIVGDGELDEGQVWEAAMFTAAKRINNLIWIVDWNKKQLDGNITDILDLFNIEEKFRSFGFDAVTINGHDYVELYNALSTEAKDSPRAIIMDTIKGKGIPEIENAANNHSMRLPQESWDAYLSRLKKEWTDRFETR